MKRPYRKNELIRIYEWCISNNSSYAFNTLPMKTSLNLLVIHGQISDGKKILHEPLSFGNADYVYEGMLNYKIEID